MDNYAIKSVTFGGFDKQDVIQYIERAAEAQKALEEENASLKEQLADLEGKCGALGAQVETLAAEHTRLQDALAEETALRQELEQLKPLREEKLERLLRRLLERETQLPVALPVGRGAVYLSRREILYAESMAYKLKIHRAGAEPLEVRWKLDELEALLRDPRFLRCHQSYLVNLDHVARAERDFLLQDGTWIPIRVRSRRQILDAYHRYFLSKF